MADEKISPSVYAVMHGLRGLPRKNPGAPPERYTTFFRSIIAFGRIHIIEDETEKLAIARILGNRYNPNQEETLQKEIEHGLTRMLAIRFDIEHLTGKEAIELVKQR